MLLRCIDTETTGLEPTDDVVEVGCYDLLPDLSGVNVDSGFQFLVRPAKPIPPEASAIHHLTNDDVADAAPWADCWPLVLEAAEDANDIVFVAHNAQFERTHFDPLFKNKWICSWKCALRVWPDMESHSLQYLRYALGLSVEPNLAMPPHRALPDAYVCGLLLVELLKHQSAETLITWSGERPVLTRFDFGKNRGQLVTESDDGYLDWLANKEHTLGDDWRWTAQQEIQRRADKKAKERADAVAAFFLSSRAGIERAATVDDLGDWYHGTAEVRSKLGIIPGTTEYDDLIEACAARKAYLQDAGGPQFEACA